MGGELTHWCNKGKLKGVSTMRTSPLNPKTLQSYDGLLISTILIWGEKRQQGYRKLRLLLRSVPISSEESSRFRCEITIYAYQMPLIDKRCFRHNVRREMHGIKRFNSALRIYKHRSTRVSICFANLHQATHTINISSIRYVKY